MRLNGELILRHLGSHYMIVDSCSDTANLTNVYVLNATAAFLWESMKGKEFTAAELVQLLYENYEVSMERATEDVASLLEVWQRYHLTE